MTASTRSPRGPHFPWASPAGPSPGADRGREGSSRRAQPGPGREPPPPAGAALGRRGEIKRGKVLPLQIGEAQLRYRRLSRVPRHVCSNCLNCFEASDPESAFGKQLLISRAESDSFVRGKGTRSAGTWELLQPSSRHRSRPPGPRPEALGRPRTASFLRQPGRGRGFSEAPRVRPVGEGKARALAPPSGGGRRGGAGARPAIRAWSRRSECLGARRSRRRQCRLVRAAPGQPAPDRRRGASRTVPSSA